MEAPPTARVRSPTPDRAWMRGPTVLPPRSTGASRPTSRAPRRSRAPTPAMRAADRAAMLSRAVAWAAAPSTAATPKTRPCSISPPVARRRAAASPPSSETSSPLPSPRDGSSAGAWRAMAARCSALPSTSTIATCASPSTSFRPPRVRAAWTWSPSAWSLKLHLPVSR